MTAADFQCLAAKDMLNGEYIGTVGLRVVVPGVEVAEPVWGQCVCALACRGV
jgi:hypothetical protein